MIKAFNVAQAGGKIAEQRLAQINAELQKLDYDEAGVEPGKEYEYLYGDENEGE